MRSRLIASVLTAAVLFSPMAAHATPTLDASPKNDSTIGGAVREAPDQKPAEVEEASVVVKADQSAEITTQDEAGDSVTVLGVSWDASDEETPQKIEYRVLDDEGPAGEWIEIETLAGDGPDPGTEEARTARQGTEPIIVGQDLDIEVRIDDGQAEVQAMTTGVTDADEELADEAVAGAEGIMPLPSAPTMAQGQTLVLDQAQASVQSAAVNRGLTYTSRAQWGANEKLRRCTPSTTSSNKAMVVHHTAGATNYTKAQVPGILRGILTYHTQSLGWCDMGYNMLVDRYGTVYEGRSGGVDKAVVGAHASGFNTGTFGVSVMGTYTSPAPKAAVDALGRVGAWQADRWGYDPAGKVTLTSSGGGSVKHGKGKKVSLPRIFGHRDTSYTACPGNGLYGQLGQVRSKAKSQVGKPKAPTYPVKGAIGKFHEKHPSMTGKPLMAEKCGLTAKGCYQRFEKGSVHWSSKSGAHFTKKNSGIQKKWKSLSYERGRLGYPTSEEYKLRGVPGAMAQDFQGGTIIWSKSTGARTVVGGIGSKWKRLNWERGYLKLPTTDEKCTLRNGGCYQKFQGGSIHWSKATGAHATKGAIQKAWGKQKYERGRLGYPKTDEFKSGGKVRQNFQGGYITWSSKAGAKIYYYR